jgi:hypothetical protein
MTNDKDYVLLCEKCAKDIGISPEELGNAIMLPKPLTDQELLKMAADKFHYTEYKTAIEFARAIEKEHGIL